MQRWIREYEIISCETPDKGTFLHVIRHIPGKSIYIIDWEKTVYITNNENGKRIMRNFIDSLIRYIACLDIPCGGYAVLTF